MSATTPSGSGGDKKWQDSMSGSGGQQQQQQPWQPAGAWTADDGGSMNNAQPWMVRLTIDHMLE